jgi:hypothetical protein
VEKNRYVNEDVSVNSEFEVENIKFVSQEKIDEAMAVVNSLKFEQMNKKLMNEYAWSEKDISLGNIAYKRWLVLAACYPDFKLVPTQKLDEYWHMHILDTKKYMEDCQLVFGKYLHHYPYFGIEGDGDYADKCFTVTKELFIKHFGEKISNESGGCINCNTACGTHGCRNNCN